MHSYPELMKNSASARNFYNEFKDVLPQDKFFTDHVFVEHCGSFQYAYLKFLVRRQSSAYRINTMIRSYFSENQGYVKRLALFAIFIQELLEDTEEMLLDHEYYELMERFDGSKDRILQLVSAMMSDAL